MNLNLLKEMETELTHSYNMLALAEKEVNDILNYGNINNLNKVLSLILKANDIILDQLENIAESNVKETI